MLLYLLSRNYQNYSSKIDGIKQMEAKIIFEMI